MGHATDRVEAGGLSRCQQPFVGNEEAALFLCLPGPLTQTEPQQLSLSVSNK